MNQGGSNPVGDGPDDPEERRSGHAEGGADEPGELMGWVPPHERTWRHPSEMFSNTPRKATTGANGSDLGSRRSHRARRAWVSVLVGTSTAAAVVAGGLVLATSVDQRQGSSVAARTTSVALPENVPGGGVPAGLQSVARTLVLISATGASGTVVREGVVIDRNGLVATTASALAGAGELTATTSGGRQMPAALVAADPQSDVAVVRVPMALPAARFANDGRLLAGAQVVAMAMTPAAGPAVVTHSWSWDTVTTVGTAVAGRAGTGMAAIETTGTSPVAAGGDVLVDTRGRIVGIQNEDATPPTGTGQPHQQVFVPSQLVLGVAHDLVSSGHVSRGWLGVEGRSNTGAASDANAFGNGTSTTAAVRRSTPVGVLVERVMAGGPAAHHLQAGDVICRLDGAPVRSMAELRTRLYVTPPGTLVHLEVLSHGAERPVSVLLGSSP